LHEYSHDTGCESITGGAFVPDDGGWPTSYDEAYLFGDYICNKIFKLAPKSGDGFTRTVFASGLAGGGPVAMAFGPHGSNQALYYTTFANGGEVRRIGYTGGDWAPNVGVKASSACDPEVPMGVGSGSTYPDGDPMAYEWDFSGSTIPVETGGGVGGLNYAMAGAGKGTVTLPVSDGLDKESTPDTIELFSGTTSSEPVIEFPPEGTTFRVRQDLRATGPAADAEHDADRNSSNTPTLEWEIRRYHNGNHYYTWAPRTGEDVTFLRPPPEELMSTDTAKNYLEIRLTVIHSQVLSEVATRGLRPETAMFASQPSRRAPD
jgi:hypothetical protein